MPQINEIHYDNTGTDVGEFIEVRVEAGYPLDNLAVYLYNGSNGETYSPHSVSVGSGLAVDSGDGYAYIPLYISGVQNGSPDGMALVDNGTVLEFLSYEGTFTATNGPALGLTSTDIGVVEPGSAPIGSSLQKTPGGNWIYTEGSNTAGAVNECFLRGTQILTSQGYKAVESLTIEDQIIDYQGVAHTVKWVGRQTIDPAANRTCPIRINAHTFGDNRPMRDLLVSPGHALFINDILINAGALVNGSTVCEVEMYEPYEYYHVELNIHTAITAEGIHAESYLPQHEDRSLYDNADTYIGDSNVLLLPMNAPRVTTAIKLPAAIRDMINRSNQTKMVS